MRTYKYKGFDHKGKSKYGLIEAVSIKDAREKLIANGILAEEISLCESSYNVPPDHRSTIYRELGVMLNAGIPLAKALDILIQSEATLYKHALGTIRDKIRDGTPLSEAFANSFKKITEFELAIIKAGEHSGQLGTMLNNLTAFMNENETLRERTKNAFVYPSVILVAGILVASLMLGFLVPRTGAMLADYGVPLPWLTRCVIAIQQIIARWGIPAVLVACAIFVYLKRKWQSDENFRVKYEKLFFKIPLAGKGVTLLANLRFTITLPVLIKAGVPLPEAMLLAGNATGIKWIAQLVESGADMVKRGTTLAEALNTIPPFSDTLPGWVEVGEASGDLAKMLEQASEKFKQQWERFIARCIALLEPVLMSIIGAFVLIIALSVLLPVLSLSKALL
jgi:type II secretory pathway component PulF